MKKVQRPYAIRNTQALHQHWTQKGGTLKPKTSFRTIDEAMDFLTRHGIKGYHPYICPDCNMWHLGHDKK